MKVLDAIKLGVEAYANARKGDLTEDQLNVDLATDTLENGTVIEYSAIEEGAEVFVIVEGEDPTLAPDGTHELSDGRKIVTVDGKISEIIPKEEEEEAAVEMSEEDKATLAVALAFNLANLKEVVDTSKDGYHTLEFSVENGEIVWGDIYSSTYKALLSNEVDPIKTKLEAEEKKVIDLNAQIALLQEVNDQKNPLENTTKLEDEKPLTKYDKMILAQENK